MAEKYMMILFNGLRHKVEVSSETKNVSLSNYTSGMDTVFDDFFSNSSNSVVIQRESPFYGNYGNLHFYMSKASVCYNEELQNEQGDMSSVICPSSILLCLSADGVSFPKSVFSASNSQFAELETGFAQTKYNVDGTSFVAYSYSAQSVQPMLPKVANVLRRVFEFSPDAELFLSGNSVCLIAKDGFNYNHVGLFTSVGEKLLQSDLQISFSFIKLLPLLSTLMSVQGAETNN